MINRDPVRHHACDTTKNHGLGPRHGVGESGTWYGLLIHDLVILLGFETTLLSLCVGRDVEWMQRMPTVPFQRAMFSC